MATGRWQANLVANEQAVRPLLIFSVTTGVGVREEADRAAEWDQRADEEVGEGGQLLDGS